MRTRVIEWPLSAVVGLLLILWPGVRATTLAQSSAARPLTLDDAIQLALKNYPALKETRARQQAAEQTIGVARAAYLPRLDLIEVFGPLNEGDAVVRRGTDEIRDGSKLSAHPAKTS